MTASKKVVQSNPRHAKPASPKAPKRKLLLGRTAAVSAAPAQRDGTKVATIVAMLRRSKGASVEEMAKAAGWQQHSVRGLISGSIKKKLALDVVSEMIDGKRRYRIAAPLAA